MGEPCHLPHSDDSTWARLVDLEGVTIRGRRPSRAHRIALVLGALALLQGVAGVAGLAGGGLADAGLRAAYDIVTVSSVALLAARAILVPRHRLAWGLMAGGLLLWAAGDLWFTLADGTPGAVSYPSASELLFIACYPLFTAGVIALARENVRGRTGMIVLDGITAALATTSLALALLKGAGTELAQAGESAYSGALAYPVCDFILLAFAIGWLSMSRGEWRRTWLLLAAGFLLASAGDTLHVYDAASGGYEFGTAYDFVWPLAAALLAWAGWQGAAPAGPAPAPGWAFAFPSLFALPALVVLLLDHFNRVGAASLALATGTIALVFARVGVALRELAMAHEAQLRAREREAESRRLTALGQLAGGVAHEFNNLLAVILNYAHVLAESLPPGDSRRGEAEEIGHTAQRAARLSQQLLMFSRRDMGRPEPVEVGPALAEIEPMVRTTVGDRVTVRVVGSREVPPVRLAPGQLDQVVLSVALNARDAMPDGGQLWIVVDDAYSHELPVELGLEPGRYVILTVRDTGRGMPDAVRERAFEPFFSTKEGGHGVGLGLATVYGIVQHAGGAVDLRSRPGAGTSVLVYLPAAPAEPGDAAAAPARHAAGPGARVLLVEDQPELRRSTARILAANGYRVLEAADGEEALAIAAAGADEIDLVVTDVLMPHMTGVELVARMHAKERGIPVILISGHPGRVGEPDSALQDDGALLLKPVRAPELLRAVAAALA
jgi:signal transduction histidine kinase/CheY-like chemotaxis protein